MASARQFACRARPEAGKSAALASGNAAPGGFACGNSAHSATASRAAFVGTSLVVPNDVRVRGGGVQPGTVQFSTPRCRDFRCLLGSGSGVRRASADACCAAWYSQEFRFCFFKVSSLYLRANLFQTGLRRTVSSCAECTPSSFLVAFSVGVYVLGVRKHRETVLASAL